MIMMMMMMMLMMIMLMVKINMMLMMILIRCSRGCPTNRVLTDWLKLTDWLSASSFVKISLKPQNSQTVRHFERMFIPPRCVTFLLSCVTCHMSSVKCDFLSKRLQCLVSFDLFCSRLLAGYEATQNAICKMQCWHFLLSNLNVAFFWLFAFFGDRVHIKKNGTV